MPVPLHGGSTVTGINFDNAASTPPLARVRDMVNRFSDLYSSVHRGTGYKSRLSTEAYEDAREMVSRFLGVDEKSQVVIFVKGTTDALNRIAAEEARLDGRQVLVTEMEHHADLLPWRHRSGHVMVGLSRDGHIDLEAIEYALKNADGRISLEHDGRPLPGERPGIGLSEPRTDSRHDRDFALEQHQQPLRVGLSPVGRADGLLP